VNTTLAIYEALIQANVPAAAARRVAETLEADMTSHLATKQDLLQLEQRLDARFDAVGTRFAAVDARLDALERQFDLKLVALEERVGFRLQSLESQLLVKLGTLITVLFGVAATLFAIIG
jgi:hypothetical protein